MSDSGARATTCRGRVKMSRQGDLRGDLERWGIEDCSINQSASEITGGLASALRGSTTHGPCDEAAAFAYLQLHQSVSQTWPSVYWYRSVSVEGLLSAELQCRLYAVTHEEIYGIVLLSPLLHLGGRCAGSFEDEQRGSELQQRSVVWSVTSSLGLYRFS